MMTPTSSSLWRRRLLPAVLVGAAVLFGTTTANAQGKEPVTHEALWLMPRVGAPAPSPDGTFVVFPVTEPASAAVQ